MKLSRARAARICRQVELLDFSSIPEPRADRGRRHPLPGLLRLLVASFAAGLTTLRGAEELSQSLPDHFRRRLGLRHPVSDGCLYDLLSTLDPAGFSEVVRRQVRVAIDFKWVGHDQFDFGVLTIDGKGKFGELGTSHDPNVRRSTCDAQGTPSWDLYAAQLSLTSSSTHLLLGQRFSGMKKTYEGKLLPHLVAEAQAHFPKLFKLVTADCGYLSRENARAILELGLDYLLGLKAQHPKLFALAKTTLSTRSVVASTTERAHGAEHRRELRRAPIPEGFLFPGAAEVWSVRSRHGGACDERLFIVSVGAAALDAAPALRLVRQHWGIENGPHWVSDVVLGEDTRCPCTAGQGVSVVSWLRMLAYNLLAMVRRSETSAGQARPSWNSIARFIRDAFVRIDDLLGIDAAPA